jgi:hypothetical protein
MVIICFSISFDSIELKLPSRETENNSGKSSWKSPYLNELIEVERPLVVL